MKITSTETAIRGVQLGEDGGREIGAIKGAPAFDAQRCGDSAQFLGHLLRTQIHVDTDAQHDVPDVVEFGPEFEQNAGHLSGAEDDVIGPLDLGLQSGVAFYPTGHGHSADHGQLRGGGRRKLRSEQYGEPEAFARRGYPLPT